MNRLKELLKLEENKFNNKTLLIYIFISYFFAILVKLILFYQIKDNSSYFYHGEIIPIWTPDASLYGFYANELLSGVSYPFSAEYIPGYLLYWIVNITGLSLNNVLFFSPIFFSSLVVIPIILIANSYGLGKIGFYSTLFGSTMASYYYRTHLGYYDTDMLNLFFPLLSIYFLIRLVDSRKIVYGVFGIFSLILFHLWYHSSTSIIISIVITFIVYVLIFERKSKYYRYYFFSFITISIILFSITDISQYFNRANDYINKQSWIEIASKNGIVKLRGDLEIVSEARAINFATLAHRVSDGKTFFIIACLGYLALLLKYRSMILTLPLILILFISLFAGLRFTIYGVPLFAFTLLYGIGLIFKIVFRNSKYSKKLVNIAIKIFLIVIVTISINNIVRYNKKLSPFYFSSADDIKALNKLKQISTPNSFIIAPWDYGWLLWYYSNIGTIVDNGKHGEDNYIVSKILLSNNQQFVRNASLFFINKYKKNSLSKIMSYFTKEYHVEYLKTLEEKNCSLPNITKNTYILLHKNMIFSTYNAIESCSNIDLQTGREYPSNLYNRFYLQTKYNNYQTILKTRHRFSIDIINGKIISTNPKENAYVREIVIIEGSKIKFKKQYNSCNNIYIIIDTNRVLVMNKKLYNSFLIQALLLNNYNHNLFDEIARDDNLLILRVK